MSDIPASLTFDNLASIALKELKAPIQLKLKDLEEILEGLRKESNFLENKHITAVEVLIRKQYNKLFSDLEKIGDISIDENGSDYTQITINPKSYNGGGSLFYTLHCKGVKKMATWKAFNKNELQCDKLHNQILKLKQELKCLDAAVIGVKDFIMVQFLSANPGHSDFKNLIRQKINEAAK